MNGINEVLLLGSVGADPETKFISETARVSSFNLATNESYIDKSGAKKEITEWHSIEAWNMLSDTISTYVKKGSNIIVRGKIKTDSYEDANGKKVYRTKIVANNINFLPNAKKDEGQVPHQPQPQQPVYQQQQPQQPQQPVYQQPQPQQPVYQQQQPQQPQQPVYQPQQPPQPVYQQQQPQQPQQPVYQPQQPQQPVYQPQQPQQPVYQQQPSSVQQAQQQVNAFVSDEQFMRGMNDDDLPF